MSFLSENLLGIFIACIVLLLYIRIKTRLNYFSDRGLPYVKPSWMDVAKFASISTFLNLPSEIYDRTRDIDSPYVGFFQVLMKPSILIRDPALVESVLIKDFSHFQDHGFDVDFKTNPLAGHLFNMKGDEWRTLRHKLVPTFTSGKLRGMVPIMEECADALIQDMNQDPALKKDTNLKELLKRYSLSVIASTAFGIEPDSVKDENCQFRKILQDVVTPSVSTRLKFSLTFLVPAIVKLFKIKMFPQEAEDFILNVTKQSFEMRRKTGLKRNDFVQLLLELKERGSVELDVKDLEQDEKENIENINTESASAKLEFTDELLAAQAFVFLFGGFENIAFLSTLTTYVLSKHPEIQARVRQEVQQAKAKHNGIDYQALRDMKLLGACMDEALRLYSPNFVVLRECNKPYTLSDGKVMEKGMRVLIPALSLQTDAKYWPNPKEFNPERFLSKDNITPGTYLPFGDGPRICIAQRLALLMSKLMVAKLLLNYELLPSSKTKEPVKIKVVVTADTEGGFWGNFKDLEN